MANKAMFALTANPFHKGHAQVLDEARKSFDEVIVALPHNPSKDALDREFLAWTMKPIVDHVEIVEGLVAERAKELGCAALVRGVRGVQDCKYEFEMADWNMTLSGMPTWFLYGAPASNKISSTALRTIHRSGGCIDKFINPYVFHRWLNGKIPEKVIYFGQISVGKSYAIENRHGHALERAYPFGHHDMDKAIWEGFSDGDAKYHKTAFKLAIDNCNHELYDELMRGLSYRLPSSWASMISTHEVIEASALGAWWHLIPPEVLSRHRLVKISTTPERRLLYAKKRGLTAKDLEKFDSFYKDPPFFDEEIVV